MQGKEVGRAMIPPATRVSLTTNRNRTKGCLELVVSTHNATAIRPAAACAL